MTHQKTNHLLSRLQGVKQDKSNHWMALCPSHEDTDPSLSITEADDRILLNCRATSKCSHESILKAIGLQTKDLFLSENGKKPQRQSRKVVKETPWDICDCSGQVIAQHVRLDCSDGSKSFKWRRNGRDGLDGLKVKDMPLYGLKWLIDEPDDSIQDIFLVEGEKATDALHSTGYMALGTVCGASVCPSEETLMVLLGRKGRIVLWPDNDDTGNNHMNMVASQLHAMDIECYIVDWPEAPQKGDAADFIQSGKETKDLLKNVCKWSPDIPEILPSHPDEVSSTVTNGLSPIAVKQICDSGWLKSYLDWASSYTDAPLAFHLATGLSLLSVAMGNRVSTTAWGRPLYPNLWIVMISPSGFYRKTTCIRLGMRILKRELSQLVLPSEWSREKLVSLLGNNPAGLFEWDEFGLALASMQKDYNAGTKEMLTKLFDSSDSYSRSTGSSGQSGLVETPAPNILGGSTIDWLRNRVKEGDLRGGFMSRFLFIPGIHKECEKDFDTPMRLDIEDDLSSWLAKLSRSDFKADFKNVKPQIRTWVRQHESHAESISPDLMGFIARGETYLLKLAMVLAASTDNTRLTITEEVLDKAIALLDFVKQGVFSTFDEMTVPREGKQLSRLRDLLKRHCPVTRSEALRLSNLPSKTFNPLLETLQQTNEVQLKVEEGRGTNKKMLHWRG